MWDLCLEMVDLANYGDPGYVRQLWDLRLKQVSDESSASCLLDGSYMSCAGWVGLLTHTHAPKRARARPPTHPPLARAQVWEEAWQGEGGADGGVIDGDEGARAAAALDAACAAAEALGSSFFPNDNRRVRMGGGGWGGDAGCVLVCV